MNKNSGEKLKILMVAAENAVLPGCKVGGIADVIRDLPIELSRQGCEVSVVTPSYGFLQKSIKGATLAGSTGFPFEYKFHESFLYHLPISRYADCDVQHYVVDCPQVFKEIRNDDGSYRIYFDDPPDRPFETDAAKFAFFCRAVAEFVKTLFQDVDCIHLHDWHSAFMLLLGRFHPLYSYLQKYRTVFTIHNLSFQGVRPFSNSTSCLESWYPDLYEYDRELLEDPVWQDCVNPMAVGIRLADCVHTVSSSYAEEILKPSNHPSYYGGEGLEKDLLNAKSDGRLVGILNGCSYGEDDYSGSVGADKIDPSQHMQSLGNIIFKWAAGSRYLPSWQYIALERIGNARKVVSPDSMIITCIGRVVEQKYFLLKYGCSMAETVIWKIVKSLQGRGYFIMLGTGDRGYEDFFLRVSAEHDNFIFLNGYSDECAELLYKNGDLFLMPSIYEPCGLSQMIAMKYGQPCLVHEVGGLKDTVQHGENGFTFKGDTIEAMARNFMECFYDAVQTWENRPDKWSMIRKKALLSRFSWEESARQYIEKLYAGADGNKG